MRTFLGAVLIAALVGLCETAFAADDVVLDAFKQRAEGEIRAKGASSVGCSYDVIESHGDGRLVAFACPSMPYRCIFIVVAQDGGVVVVQAIHCEPNPDFDETPKSAS